MTRVTTSKVAVSAYSNWIQWMGWKVRRDRCYKCQSRVTMGDGFILWHRSNERQLDVYWMSIANGEQVLGYRTCDGQRAVELMWYEIRAARLQVISITQVIQFPLNGHHRPDIRDRWSDTDRGMLRLSSTQPEIWYKLFSGSNPMMSCVYLLISFNTELIINKPIRELVTIVHNNIIFLLKLLESFLFV